MNELAIKMLGVSKSFGRHHVLHDLNLEVPERSIFAFVGNNGEGKSTAIRLIVGLMQPDRGHVQVFGKNMRTHKKEVLAQIGCLVEAPSIYPNLTAHEFLKIACVLKSQPAQEIDRVLELVGLRCDRQTLISRFSLGMKQRLALAHALLGQPKLLILDEPTNGLDPSGIQEMRELICRLPEMTGATVFVSSHQLDELDKMATHLALLHGGVLRCQANLNELRSQQKAVLHVRVDDADKAINLLQGLGYQTHLSDAHRFQVKEVERDAVWRLNELLVQAGLRLHESHHQSLSLEHWFHQQTQQNNYGGVA